MIQGAADRGEYPKLPDLPQRTLFPEKVFIEFYVYRKKRLFLKRENRVIFVLDWISNARR
jgi:hypothetical protein